MLFDTVNKPSSFHHVSYKKKKYKFATSLTLVINKYVYKKLDKLEQIINNTTPKKLKDKLAEKVHWGPTTTIRLVERYVVSFDALHIDLNSVCLGGG